MTSVRAALPVTGVKAAEACVLTPSKWIARPTGPSM
jgi:hypothetical protein